MPSSPHNTYTQLIVIAPSLPLHILTPSAITGPRDRCTLTCFYPTSVVIYPTLPNPTTFHFRALSHSRRSQCREDEFGQLDWPLDNTPISPHVHYNHSPTLSSRHCFTAFSAACRLSAIHYLSMHPYRPASCAHARAPLSGRVGFSSSCCTERSQERLVWEGQTIV